MFVCFFKSKKGSLHHSPLRGSNNLREGLGRNRIFVCFFLREEFIIPKWIRSSRVKFLLKRKPLASRSKEVGDENAKHFCGARTRHNNLVEDFLSFSWISSIQKKKNKKIGGQGMQISVIFKSFLITGARNFETKKKFLFVLGGLNNFRCVNEIRFSLGFQKKRKMDSFFSSPVSLIFGSVTKKICLENNNKKKKLKLLKRNCHLGVVRTTSGCGL